MPADGIVENFEAGESAEEIAYNFDLGGDVRTVLAYASTQTVSKQAS